MYMEIKFIYTRILPLTLMGLAVFVGLVRQHKLQKSVKIALLICIINLLSEIAGYMLTAKGYKNIWLYNIADVVRYQLWFLYYWASCQQQLQKKYYVYLIVAFLIVYGITLYYQPLAVFQTISFIGGGIMLLSCAVIFYMNEYRSTSTQKLTANPHFWISTGLLIYYTLNLPFIGLYNFLFKASPIISKSYFLVCVIGSSLILSSFMIKAFVCQPTKPKYGT